jgi:precorrin-2 methylase
MMRLDVDFSRSLSLEERNRVLVAVATLAKAQKVRFIRDATTAVIMAEGLSMRRVEEVLVEMGLPPQRIDTSLDPEADRMCDDLEQDPERKERIRAIGR